MSIDFNKELDKFGLTETTWKNAMDDVISKMSNLKDIDWDEIVKKYNIKCNPDTLRKASQTPFGGYFVSEYLKQCANNPTDLQKARDIIGEQMLLKTQLKNEKQQVGKFVKELVKSVSLAEDIVDSFKKYGMNIIIPEYCKEPIIDTSEKAMLVIISDWHIGYKIINCKGNYFNYEIANERVNKFIDAIYKYIDLYDINKVYVYSIGDMVENTYMRNTQNQYCEFYQGEQIEKATKLIYRFITALSEKANVVYDSIAGNHDRMNGDKTQNYDGDNVNSAITPLLQFMVELSENKRIHIVERNYADKEITVYINDLNIKLVHGHEHTKDDKNKIKNEISMDNCIYDLYIEGHWHNYRCISENNNRYLVTNGCLSGYNDYSTAFGCATCASQTIMVLGDREIEMIKDVQLSDLRY